ncbi:MAG TPA: condensation domain-containing protein, partial [Thermoanaerobaculia bacterium]|nr:condensation domain-containing protein [Thermoanaerobaculia bacterium]
GVRVALRALFEAPRLADFARRVAAARSATSGEAASARPSLRPEPRAGHPPLSLGQRRLWWMDRLHAGAPLFNLPSAVRLTGELAVNALARALGEVVRRHEVLRTVFVETEGGLGQVIGSAAPVALPHVDLSGLARGLRSGAVERLAAEGSRRPFDLARGPLLRAALLSLDRREHVLLLVIHHAVFDAWSQAILVHELAVLYAAFAENRPSPLPALPVQYADFAIWQRRLLSGQGLDSELAYWRRQLAGPLPRLRLPYSREKEAASGLAGARHRFALAPALQTGLRRLAREQGATLFMVLLAGFQTLLHRYCGEADLVVGTDVANRTEVETEGLIGFFANQLVLRTDLAGDPPAAELLARVREVVFAAHAHQELPFDRLVEELNPERGGGSAELFQVKLGLVNVPAARLAAQGLDLALLEVDNGIAQNELLLFMGEIGERLVGALQYRTELFSAAAVDRLRRHLETLWAAMVERPALRLSELPLLGEEERHQLLKEWNDAESASRQGAATVHGRFAAQAERTPRAVAMASEGQRWSYEEIDARANRLAHLLCHMGVGPEVRVALCAEASMDMVVGVLGILKSGGAYVPLDPKAPPARLAWQLADSRVALVLAGEGLQNLLPPQGPIVVPLGAGWEAGESASAPEEQAVEENLAYVIYTSGSTGRPKGVMVPHRGVVGYLEWACRQYGLSPGRGAILHTGLAFDLTVTSLLGPLLSGGTVTVAAGEAASGLARALAHGGGRDLVKLTPPHLPVLSAALTAELGKAWEGRLAGLVPMMVVGGEALPGASLGVWRRHAPELSVVNEYGPTEASVGCCAWMGPAGAIGEGEVPIGRPIAGARLVTVDAGL